MGINGQKNTSFTGLTEIIAATIFGALNLYDILISLLFFAKHGPAYESNPIYAWTGSITVMMIFKLIVVAAFIYYLVYYYKRTKMTFMRYFMVYYLVIITLILTSVAVSNTEMYLTPAENIGDPIPTEQKPQEYYQGISEMEHVKPKSQPMLQSMFVLNMIQFGIFLLFEKSRLKWMELQKIRQF